MMVKVKILTVLTQVAYQLDALGIIIETSAKQLLHFCLDFSKPLYLKTHV